MNGKEPKEALDQWLLREKAPDIIVVGIQEIGKVKPLFSFFLGTAILSMKRNSNSTRTLISANMSTLKNLKSTRNVKNGGRAP